MIHLAAAAVLAGSLQTLSPLDSADRYIRSELVRQRIPGLSVAVLRGDSVVLSRGYGFANLEHRVPATDSTVYQSGSVGKQFTAAAVAMLAQDGRLRLDDPLTRYLPQGGAAWSGITLRHLLTHTSGIPDYADSTLDYRRAYSEDDLVRLAAALPLEFRPGERWSYSNTGYLLLGAVIRRVTGRFYGDFLRERIFGPAHMRTARVISESAIVPNRAAGYQRVHGELQNQEWVSPELNTTADGSLYLTVRDLAAWARALNHGEVPSRAVLEQSWTPVRLNGGGTYPYGLGWRVAEQRGSLQIGHTGSWQGFKASIQRYPEFDLTVIVLANLAEALPEAISYGIAGILEPKLAAPHRFATALQSPAPPRPIPELVRAFRSGEAGAFTSGLWTFASSALRGEVGEALDGKAAWTFLGCDEVGGRGISRLGARVERICYARGVAPEGAGTLVTVLYDGRWNAADIEYYDF